MNWSMTALTQRRWDVYLSNPRATIPSLNKSFSLVAYLHTMYLHQWRLGSCSGWVEESVQEPYELSRHFGWCQYPETYYEGMFLTDSCHNMQISQKKIHIQINLNENEIFLIHFPLFCFSSCTMQVEKPKNSHNGPVCPWAHGMSTRCQRCSSGDLPLMTSLLVWVIDNVHCTSCRFNEDDWQKLYMIISLPFLFEYFDETAFDLHVFQVNILSSLIFFSAVRCKLWRKTQSMLFNACIRCKNWSAAFEFHLNLNKHEFFLLDTRLPCLVFGYIVLSFCCFHL